VPDSGTLEGWATVQAAIGLGHDTDTTAALTGGIAGIRDGIVEVPRRWRDGLRGQELVAPLLEQLLAGRE